MTFQQINFTNF